MTATWKVTPATLFAPARLHSCSRFTGDTTCDGRASILLGLRRDFFLGLTRNSPLDLFRGIITTSSFYLHRTYQIGEKFHRSWNPWKQAHWQLQSPSRVMQTRNILSPLQGAAKQPTSENPAHQTIVATAQLFADGGVDCPFGPVPQKHQGR